MITRSRCLSTCLATIALSLMICSCENRHPGSPQVSNTRPATQLIIRAIVAGADLQYDSLFHDSVSRAFVVTDFRYYISNIKGIRDDGTEHRAPRAVLLINPGRKGYDIGPLPVGAYKAIRFTLGLDSATNHSDPTVFDTTNPLAIQTPSMHWDWNSGYLFMKLEGRVDTTIKGTGVPATEFFYHLGMDGMERTIDLPLKFLIGTSSADTVRVKFDLAILLACVDMRVETSTHSFDNHALAARMADRWQAAFSVDK